METTSSINAYPTALAVLVAAAVALSIGWFGNDYFSKAAILKQVEEAKNSVVYNGGNKNIFKWSVTNRAGNLIDVERELTFPKSANSVSKISSPAKEKGKFDLSGAEVYRQGEEKDTAVFKKEQEEFLSGKTPFVFPPTTYALEKSSINEIKAGDFVLIFAGNGSSGGIPGVARAIILKQ